MYHGRGCGCTACQSLATHLQVATQPSHVVGSRLPLPPARLPRYTVVENLAQSQRGCCKRLLLQRLHPFPGSASACQSHTTLHFASFTPSPPSQDTARRVRGYTHYPERNRCTARSPLGEVPFPLLLKCARLQGRPCPIRQHPNIRLGGCEHDEAPRPLPPELLQPHRLAQVTQLLLLPPPVRELGRPAQLRWIEL